VLSSTTIASKQPILLRGEALAKAVASISFPFSEIVQSRRSFLAAAWALRRHGIICLRGAGSNQDLTSIRHEIHNLLENIQSNDLRKLQEVAYLNLPNNRVLKGYNNFRDADRAVINYRVKRPDGRTGSDAGMIDIFHPERLSFNLEERVKNCLHEHFIQRLLLVSSLNRLRVKCRNLYLNQGVQDTRGFHCDGRSLKFKSFVYISDVNKLNDGPYCYVKGSHRRRRLWRNNSTFNKENQLDPFEFSQLQDSQAISVFAQAGDMVISSQKGAHCGHPQHAEAKRAVLVNMYQR
tara:strand:+ start:15 stop:893 length:879 start_codon:yes stop_codon:yes gene_type:complete